MTNLVACLSSGKGTWGHVGRLIADHEWEKVVLITNDFGRQNFKSEKPVELIVVDSIKPMEDLIEDIRSALDGKVTGTEVALNLVSGTGKEHMALLSAVLKLGLGVRLIAITKNGVKEL
ncbi:hypothetical protein KY337_05160 [Candidatus Woesearchaeota archaeon]|nr:hypothetical protein [Candidatus Woesearchaeota archaeon]